MEGGGRDRARQKGILNSEGNKRWEVKKRVKMYKSDKFEINASVVEIWGDLVCRCINTIELFCFVCFVLVAWYVCLSGGVQPVSYYSWRTYG